MASIVKDLNTPIASTTGKWVKTRIFAKILMRASKLLSGNAWAIKQGAENIGDDYFVHKAGQWYDKKDWVSGYKDVFQVRTWLLHTVYVVICKMWALESHRKSPAPATTN